MRIFTALIILFLSATHFSLKAQLVDKVVPHFGFMYEFINLSEGDSVQDPFTDSQPFYTVHVGTYYALAHKNDVLSVGIDPSIQGGIRLNGNGISWMLQAPIFLMGKVGANSTPYNEQKIGFALGVGANFTYVNINNRGSIIDPFNGETVSLDLKKFFYNPQVVIEGTVNSRGGPISGRIHFSLLQQVKEGVVFSNGFVKYPFPQVEYNNFGLGIIYGF
ncbi:hypothetical protein N9933_03535 [bacterium]|nr:hypothetical protein [bacterium]